MKRGLQSGNGTLLVIFGLFALGLAGGIYCVFSTVGADPSATAKNSRAAYDAAVASLDKALQNPASVQASLDRNPSFSCFFSNDGNCKSQGGAFLLFETATSAHSLSQLANDAGVDELGMPCNGFPSKECPLRVETAWVPVCAGDRCESTHSLTVKAKVTLAPINPGEAPIEWTKDAMFTPQILLSRSTECARQAMEWTGSECLTPSQIAERRLASPTVARLEQAQPPIDQRDTTVTTISPAVYECPQQIVVQGQYYPVQFIAADRGQITIPSMSCPQPGMQDVFVFQCSVKNPAAFPNEGQWIQVEAVMAPACDGGANAPANLPTRF
jgi:hypothetical protein